MLRLFWSLGGTKLTGKFGDLPLKYNVSRFDSDRVVFAAMQIKVEWREEEPADDCLDDVLGPNNELFPGLSLPCDELCAELDDLDMIWPDARELRNHDCMWAGLCVSEKHERDSVRPERVILPPARRRVVAPTNARSLLLPPPPRLPDRPDTPLSENELDLDLPELCDLLEDLPSVVPSEVTGQVAAVVKTAPPQPLTTPQQQPCTVTAYVTPNMDHCYFTTALPPEHPVHPDSLGVQTPSDSGEYCYNTILFHLRTFGWILPCSVKRNPWFFSGAYEGASCSSTEDSAIDEKALLG